MTETPSPSSRHRSASPTAPRPTSPAVRPAISSCAEPLVGDGAVAKHLAGPDIRVGGQHVTGGREQQRDGHLGDRVGVAARRVQHRYPGGGGAGDVDVVGITAGGRDGPQRELEHRSAHRIGLHHKDIGAFCAGAVGQLLGGVDPQRGLVDPRVVDHIGQLAQLVETRPPQRGGHQGTRSRGHDCPCWRTVTRVSREEVTIGIDIGTTAVKAVAADEHGQVVARTRIPHRAAGTGTGQARARRRAGMAQRPGGGPRAAGPPRRPRGGRLGDGPVPDRGRRRRQSRSRRACCTATAAAGFRLRPQAWASWSARRPSSCGGRRGKRPPRRGTGPRPRWPTTRWRARR